MAQSFAMAHTGRVYFFDLLGAACGVACVAMLLPLLREEGTHAIWAALAFLTPLAFGVKPANAVQRLAFVASLTLAASLVVFAIINPVTFRYNLAVHCAQERQCIPV